MLNPKTTGHMRYGLPYPYDGLSQRWREVREAPATGEAVKLEGGVNFRGAKEEIARVSSDVSMGFGRMLALVYDRAWTME